APAPAEKSAASVAKPAKTSPNRESGSIRVSIEKVDLLINLVGELVITQSMLNQAGLNQAQGGGASAEALLNGLAQLERNTRELQENMLQLRMLPINVAFNRFPRLVRDLCNKMGNKVDLVLTGEQTEVDKTVLEKIGDPLVHLVRNSLDHGLETPEVRAAAGKPEQGRLELSAQHESGNIVIRIIDDGAGLNREKILQKAIENGLVSDKDELSEERIDNLIFQPGFSTADKVSDLSGRGVGMDVVKRNINDLGGTVSIHSRQGEGSTVMIRLPLTLAILDGQLASIGEDTYILPLISIVESLQIRSENLNSVAGSSELYRFRDEYIPIIRLNSLLGNSGGIENLEQGLLVVVEAEGQHAGLFVDRLQEQQQVVIKSLETNFQQLEGVSGATILGDGQVALILDIPGLVHLFHKTRNQMTVPALAAAS
ncbi:chemotaxis protein CheA, partial [Thiolapillus sp.]